MASPIWYEKNLPTGDTWCSRIKELATKMIRIWSELYDNNWLGSVCVFKQIIESKVIGSQRNANNCEMKLIPEKITTSSRCSSIQYTQVIHSIPSPFIRHILKNCKIPTVNTPHSYCVYYYSLSKKQKQKQKMNQWKTNLAW